MIDYIKLLPALLLPVFAGYVVTCIIAPKKDAISEIERLALSYLIGCGIFTLLIFIIGAFGIALTLPNICIAAAIALAAPAVIAAKNKALALDLRSMRLEHLKWYEAVISTLIVLRAAFVLFEDLIKPVISVDAFANWSLRAKVFFFESGLSVNAAGGYFAGGGQTFYPINIPLMETWIAKVLGYWNDELFKVIFGLFLISLLTVFYCSIRRFASRPVSLLSTYLLSTLPLLVHHATIEYTDLPLCVYFICSALFLLNYFESNDERHLYFSSLLAGISAWTKSEGMSLLLINLFVLFVHLIRTNKDAGKMFGSLSKYLLIGLAFKIPWSVFNFYYHIPKNVWQKIEYTKVFENLYRIPVIIEYFYRKLFFYGNWNIAWFVFIAALIFSLRDLKKTRYFYSLMLIILVMSAFAFLYYITPSYQWLLEGTTLNRNILIIMPMVIYFISLSLNEACKYASKKEK